MTNDTHNLLGQAIAEKLSSETREILIALQGEVYRCQDASFRSQHKLERQLTLEALTEFAGDKQAVDLAQMRLVIECQRIIDELIKREPLNDGFGS